MFKEISKEKNPMDKSNKIPLKKLALAFVLILFVSVVGLPLYKNCRGIV